MVHQDKIDSSGNYLRTKSRICPQGFRLRPGIEFDPDEVASHAPHVQTIMIGLQIWSAASNVHKSLGCNKLFPNLQCTSRRLQNNFSHSRGIFVSSGYAIHLINALQGSPQPRHICQDKEEHFLISTLGFQQLSIDPSYYFRRDGECFM
jgi:hypothetical protein